MATVVGFYVKKPVTVEAVRIDTSDYDGLCTIVAWCGGRAIDTLASALDRYLDPGVRLLMENAVIAIDTLEGTMYAAPGDWIIRGIKGEFYPCRSDIFDATYEPVTTHQ